MSLQSRLEKLESVQTTIRDRQWFWQGAVPDQLEVGARVIDRLPGEPDNALLDRVSQMDPQVEFTIFRWLDPESDSA